MHIAAALKTPLIALFGSSSPQYTPPLSINSKIISLTMSCSPCFERTCPLGHTKCLTEIEPRAVMKEVLKLTERI
jgi:heptosyltransferase-2